MIRKSFFAIPTLFAIALVGCGSQAPPGAKAPVEKPAGAAAKNEPAKVDAFANRKIRYTASVHVVVKKLEESTTEVETIVERYRA